jgi:hypothetical protein
LTPALRLLCPACGSRVTATDLAPACPACGARIELLAGTGFEAGGPIGRCAACGSEALHVAKDFNRNAGLAIVALGAAGFYWGALAGVASLAALTVLDRVVYRLRPEVTVCYACKAVYRGVARNPIHRPYELTYDETFEGTGARPRVIAPDGGAPSTDGKPSRA